MNCIRLKLSKMACNSENPAMHPGAAEDTHESDQHQTGDLPQPLRCFRFLAAKQANQQQTAEHSSCTSESVQSQISQYLSEVRDGSFVSSSSVLAFWQERQLKCDKLARWLWIFWRLQPHRRLWNASSVCVDS